MITWIELLHKGKKFLRDAEIADFDFDALQLLLTFFNGEYSLFCLKSSETVADVDFNEYFSLLKRRAEKEPLQYIIGRWDFYKSSFFVGDGVLIPRPETEELVDSVIKLIKKNKFRIIYDLCTGSGCIGLSIAKEFPETICYLFDFYDEALNFTRKNLESLSLNNVKIIKCDILSDVPDDIENADMIVSNPPYIETETISSLQTEVLKEPITALDGGSDGLMFYRAIKEKWSERLNFSGMIAFECGENQCNHICDMFSSDFETYINDDNFGVSRFVYGTKLRK